MLTISRLRCEYLVNPLGIDERAPRFSWELAADRRGARQVAYRIQVSSAPPGGGGAGGGGDKWDSGWVKSDASSQIAYAGRPLKSRDVCHWVVEVEDERGEIARSEAAHFSMGLLEKSDWKASWIAADPEIVKRDKDAIVPTLTEPGTPALFRKEFPSPAAIKRATLYASARGLLDVRLSGQRVGDDLFAPEWTDYQKRIHYRTYDVTGLLKEGANALAVMLGDGWWSGYVGWQETRGRYGSLENSFLLQLEIETVDGQRLIVASDPSWRCNTGPILASDFMMGETYDARRERTGWDLAGFKDADWLPAKQVDAPHVKLVAQRSEPVRIIETLKPLSCKEITKGTFIYDLGQNLTGFVRLRVPPGTPAGTRIQIRQGERLSPDGTLYTENLRRAKSTDVYITKGGADETYQPHFTFHGFQYVEITGLSNATADTVTACVIHSATPPAGQFECSHKGINRLWLNGLWSQKDNFLTVPTDCPQRDERLGWMGDAQVFLRTATCNMDVAAFFTKWMIDVEDAQTPDGIFPDVAPRVPEDIHFVGLDGLCGAAGWADAGVIVPYTLWRVYGDQRLIERHWQAMTAWLNFLERTNPTGLRVNALFNNYGDWLCIPSDTTFRTHSPMKNLLATAYWADDAAKMAHMARELGRHDDEHRFSAMFRHVRDAFQKEFIRDDGSMTVETQTAYLLALAFNLMPDHLRDAAAKHLVDNIKALDNHLSTGFIGISHLNPQLTLAGYADVAYTLLLQESYPSWLYPVNHGATTIWERWNGWTEKDGFFNPHMNSFNHYSLGSVGEWLFRHMAGIELAPDTHAFKQFHLRPYLPRKATGLTFAKASYHSHHGEIASHWQRDGDTVTWTVRVPANTMARAYIPADASAPVTESDKPLMEAEGVQLLAREPLVTLADLSPGTYTFTSTFRD